MGFFSSVFGGQKQKTNDYRISQHIGVCIGPVDTIHEIFFNQKEIGSGSPFAGTPTPISASTSAYYSNKYLFGGDLSGGGIEGNISFFFGDEDQVLPVNLTAKFGDALGAMPGFRNLLSIFLYGGNTGGGFKMGSNNAYLPPIALKVTDLCHVLDDKSAIGLDVNPAHMIYEIMTNQDWGKGEDPSRMDQASYLAASAVLRKEGLGLSLLWDQQQSIDDFLNNVLDHISAKHDIHPATGLWTLKLLRGDYNALTLPALDRSNSKLDTYQRKLYAEIPNHIVVEWLNPSNEQVETVTAQNDASIAIQGAQISLTRAFHGVRSSGLAQKLANRELKAVSLELLSGTSLCDRSCADIFPGDVVQINYDFNDPSRDVLSIVARVVSIDRGSSDDQHISIDWTQDVFAVQYETFADVSTAFISPLSAGLFPVTTYEVATAPYYLVAATLGVAATQALVEPQVYTALLLARPSTDTRTIDYYSNYVNAAGQTTSQLAGTIAPCPVTSLTQALVAEYRSTVSLVDPAGAVSGNFIYLTDGVREELCVVTATTSDGKLQVTRGVLDTVPLAWPAAAQVWVIGPSGSVLDQNEQTDGAVAEYEFLPVTSAGRLDISQAPVVSCGLTSRMYRPYRPTNISFPAKFNVLLDGNLNVSFARRNRLMETGPVLAFDDADVFPEQDQTTTIQIVGRVNGTVYCTVSGLTGTTGSVSDFTKLPSGTDVYILRVFAVRDGLTSYSNVDGLVTITK